MMTRNKIQTGRRRILAGTGGVAITALSGCMGRIRGGGGEDFPSKPIKLIVPFGTGGGFDTYTRLVAKHMTDHVDVDVRVENVEGGKGVAGLKQVRNAEPDGYTNMLMWLDGYAKKQVVEDVEYDLLEMTFLPQVASTISTLNVGTNSGIKTWDDFLKKVKNDDITFGAGGGVTASGGLIPALLGRMTGEFSVERVGKNTVAFDGKGPMINAVKRGEVDVVVSSQGSSAPFIESGDLRRIATFAKGDEKQTDVSSNVKNFQELGVLSKEQFQQLRDFSATKRAFGGPPEVPEERANVLRDAITKTIKSDVFLEDAKESERSVKYADSAAAKRAAENLLKTWENNLDVLERLKKAAGSS